MSNPWPMADDADYTVFQVFTRGDRVELHPGCDLWARGARFGTVHGSLPDGRILVRMDNSRIRSLVNVTADRLRPVR